MREDSMPDGSDSHATLPAPAPGPGLGASLGLILTGTVAILLLVGAGLAGRALAVELAEERRARAEAVARHLASAVTAPLLAGDLAGARARLLDGAGASTVDYLLLQAPDGRLLAHTLDGPAPAALDVRSAALGVTARLEIALRPQEPARQMVDAEAPILDGQLGSVRAGIEDLGVARALLRTGAPYGLLWLAAGVLSAALGWLLIRRALAPLGRLAAVARRFDEGDIDAQPTVETRDEVGAVAEALGEALERVRRVSARADDERREREALLDDLDSVRATVDAIGAGDLTRRARPSSAALRPLADALEAMSRALAEKLRAARGPAGAVSRRLGTGASNEDTVATADQPAASGERLRAELTNLARAMGEVARHANSSREAAETIGARAVSGQRRVTRALGDQQQVQLAVQGTAQRLAALEHRLASFRTIVESISQLASGPSLVGPASNPEAVDPDRLRGLAADLAQATQYIHAQMDNALREVRDAIAATEQSSRAVVSAVETTRGAGDRLQEIARAAAGTARLAETIAGATSLDDVEAMSRAISDTVALAERWQATARETAGEDRELVRAANELRAALERFEL